MPTPEQGTYQALKRALDRIPGLVHDRLESRVAGTGLPDVVYTYYGTGWIENKYSAAKTRVSLARWTTPQRRWASRCWRAGGDVFLFVECPWGFYLFPCNRVVRTRSLDLDEADRLAAGRWSGPVDHRELARILW